MPSPKYRYARAVHLYLPRTSWPDFVIYVVMPRSSKDTPAFYIIPRGALSTDTEWALGRLESYRGNWKQLREVRDDASLERTFKFVSPVLQSAIIEANNKNLSVKPIKKSGRKRLLPFYQHRVLIADVACTVMSAPRVERLSDTVFVRRPTDSLGAVVIYVVKEPTTDEKRFFVIPAAEILKTTTRSLGSEWLKRFEDGWQLLKSSANPKTC